jgi:hypothetical protein
LSPSSGFGVWDAAEGSVDLKLNIYTVLEGSEELKLNIYTVLEGSEELKLNIYTGPYPESLQSIPPHPVSQDTFTHPFTPFSSW